MAWTAGVDGSGSGRLARAAGPPGRRRRLTGTRWRSLFRKLEKSGPDGL